MSQVIFLGAGGGGGGTIISLTGNTGGPILPDGAGNISVPGSHGINSAGAGSTITFALDNAIVLGDLAAITFGNDAVRADTGDINIVSGDLKLPLTDVNTGAVLVNGDLFLHNFSPVGPSTTGSNVFLGLASGNTTLTTANQNVCIGANVTPNIDTAAFNCIMGYAAGPTVSSAINNVWLGAYAGLNSDGTEESTIYIGAQLYSTVAGEICTLRIGRDTGIGVGFLNQAFICGIKGISVGSVAEVVVVNASNQLGSSVLTAGTGISITPAANTITIAATGATVLPFTDVTTSPYVALNTDYFLSVDTSSIPITIQLPDATTLGTVFIVKDRTGNAFTNNITVTSVTGSIFIDGATTFTLNADYASGQFIYDAANYEVF